MFRLAWGRRADVPRTGSVNDAPTDHDLLDYRQLTDPIAQHILSLEPNQTPLTIGVYGEWGSGKTSFLRMIDSELRKGGVRPVWFHAWKYEREENLWAALIQTIVGQGTIGGTLWQKLRAKVRLAWRQVRLAAIAEELTGSMLNLVVRGLIIVACIAIIELRDELSDYFRLAPTVAAVIAAIAALAAAKPDALLGLFSAKIGIDVTRFTEAPSYRQHIAFLDDFTSELRSIIRIAGAGKPVVVVIDDLDRCLPEKALQVLEAMKLFLDVTGAVFLLAVDRDVIQHAVGYKYRGSKELAAEDKVVVNLQADSYLEKLVHLSFTLLPLGPAEIERLIRGVCDEETARWAELFASALPPNPRTVKRTLQMFVFIKRLAGEKLHNGAMSEALLAKMVVMYEQCREIYRDLPRFETLIHELEKMARDSNHEIKDQALADRAKQLLAKFPRLRPLLEDKTDSFEGKQLDDYLKLLRSVHRRPATPIPVSFVADRLRAEQLPLRLKREDGTLVPLEVDALLSAPRIVLRGPRGSGKTTLLRKFAAQLMDRRIREGSEPKTPLPIYLNLRDLPTLAIVNSRLRKDLERVEEIESGNAWVLIDDLDGSRAEPEVIDAVAEVVARYPSNRYILATRLPGLDLPMEGFVYYDIQPPSQVELTAYLEQQLGERGEELARQLMETELVKSPRLVRLALDHAKNTGKVGNLIELFVANTLERLPGENLEPAVVRRLLIMMAKRHEQMIIEPVVLSIAHDLGVSAADALHYVTLLSSDDAGLLVQPRPGSYAFSHDAFADFFRNID